MLRKLFKQSLLYFLTLVAGKVLTAIIFILLGRILQPEKFGLITYFVTLVQLISVLADFGLRSWYQKMMAQKKDQTLFSGLFLWRLLFYGLSLIIVILISFITTWIKPSLLIPLSLALLLEALISSADAYYLAQQKSLFLGYKLIARNLFLFPCLWLIKSPADYHYFFTIYNLSSLGVLICYFPYQALNWCWLKSRPSLPNIKKSLPYASIDGLGMIYSKADSLLIENLISSTALGLYGASYRYLDAFNLLPQALFHNLFPLAAKKNAITRKQIVKMVTLMTFLGLVLASMVFIASDWLTITLMGPAFAPAGQILRYLTLVIVLFFFNAPLNTMIQSSDQVQAYVPKLTMIVILSLILNWFFLPYFGILGATYTLIICQIVLIFNNLVMMKKISQS